MNTSIVQYVGNLRTEATHLRSNTILSTDAPVDNHGKGQNFSPTDLLATSLASCMLTIMGIVARNNQFDLGHPEADVLKIMNSEPRRVKEIQISIRFPQCQLDKKAKRIIERAALNCPVALSLNTELKQTISFKYE